MDITIDLTQNNVLNDISDQVHPEVFETSDTSGDDDDYIDDNIKDKQLENIELKDPKEIRINFENKILDNISSDYSGRIDKVEVTGFKGTYIEETIDQKMARIKRELQEIQISSKESKYEHNSISLQLLYDQMEKQRNVSLKQISTSLNINDHLYEHVTLPKLNIDYTISNRLMTLENRLTTLEKFLGSDQTNKKPLITIINELHRQVRILTNNESILSNFDKKMKEISENYENSIIGRRAKKDHMLEKLVIESINVTDTKVEELYKFYNVLKRYSIHLPAIVRRLETLNQVHLHIKETIHTVDLIDNTLNNLQAQADKWDTTLKELDLKLNEQEEAFQNNKHSIEEWLKTIENKLDSF